MKSDLGVIPHPTSDWINVQDKFYRKIEQYAHVWDVEFKDFMCAVAPNGGPIGRNDYMMVDIGVAYIRKDKRLILAKRGFIGAAMIRICTCAGILIHEVPWENGTLMGMGWASGERLVCVSAEGQVSVFNLRGECTQLSLGIASSVAVIDCRFWQTGVAAMLSDYKVVTISDYENSFPVVLKTPEMVKSKPHDWAVIPPSESLAHSPEVFMAIDSTVIVLDSTGVTDQRLSDGPFCCIRVSPNGKLVALFNTSGKLLVVSTDFDRKFSEHDTGSAIRPTAFAWCGTDSVVVYRDYTLTMIGPFGGNIQYPYSSDEIILVTEVDGLRIISQSKCELLQKVPDAVERVFKIGSAEPAALLYEAFQHFEKGDPKAEEFIREINVYLSDAVDQCLEAAGHEFSVYQQKNLLKAASLGKSFLDGYTADTFVQTCQTLRVLNALRQADVGLPLSYAQ